MDECRIWHDPGKTEESAASEQVSFFHAHIDPSITYLDLLVCHDIVVYTYMVHSTVIGDDLVIGLFPIDLKEFFHVATTHLYLEHSGIKTFPFNLKSSLLQSLRGDRHGYTIVFDHLSHYRDVCPSGMRDGHELCHCKDCRSCPARERERRSRTDRREQHAGPA